LHTIKNKTDNYLPKVTPRQQEVLRRENALKARQGGSFEFTANKLFKFHDVIARLHVYYGMVRQNEQRSPLLPDRGL
jgi:hypothetical protein